MRSFTALAHAAFVVVVVVSGPGLFCHAAESGGVTDTAAADLDWKLASDYGSALVHARAVFGSGKQPLNYYNRLPAEAQTTTRASIWGLQQDPAGMFLQFQTNSSTIAVNYTLGSSNLDMWHFSATGVSGVDLYSYDEGNKTWRWVATPTPTFPVTEAVLVQNAQPTPTTTPGGRLYRLHLPTYNTIKDDLSIGLDAGSSFLPDNATLDGSSIVWYGSSILQGAVASRPGLIATHQVSRKVERLIYNYGFSGNCWMETNVAQYLVDIVPAPGLFIIDCNPNMVGFPPSGGTSQNDIFSHTVPLVDFIRSHGFSTTPIILSEGAFCTFCYLCYLQAYLQCIHRNYIESTGRHHLRFSVDECWFLH